MFKNSFITLSLFLSITLSSNAQNASDYFPSATAFKWYYITVPYDSLNRTVDSLSFVSIDSFTVNQVYVEKPAKIIIGKEGSKVTVLNKSFNDSNYVSFDSSNIWTYMNSFPGTDTLAIGLFNTFHGWYSTYRLSQPLNSAYTIYTKDTLVNYNGFNTTLTHVVNAKRIADQIIPSALGDFLCKKFILSFSIRAKISILSFTVLTISDTIYIAPGNYIISDIRPSANVDLSFFGQDAYYIPGSKMDVLAPPPILDVNYVNLLANYSPGDSSFAVFNSGSDILHWNAKIISGTSWLHLIDSIGTGNGTVKFAFDSNPDNIIRIGIISLNDSIAWASPRIITVVQGQNIASLEDENIPPVHYALFQNYPNPFNPSTLIKYSLPYESNVKIIVCNSIGQVVKNLVSEVQQSGLHEQPFFSSSLSSGIYFYTILANSVDGKQNYRNTKKMIILK